MHNFKGFDALADHFAMLAAKLPTVMHSELDAAGEAIEKRAKQKIGEYQQAAGPFRAWEQLADSTKADRRRKGFPENEPLLRTGHMRGTIEHKREGKAVHVGSDDPIVDYQERGTNRIPPRSFLGGALFELAHELHRKFTRRIGRLFESGL